MLIREELETFISDCDINEKPEFMSFQLEMGYVNFIGHQIIDSGRKVIYYLFPMQQDKLLVFVYFGRVYDKYFDTVNSLISHITVTAFTNAWPLLIEAFANRVNNIFSEPYLFKFEDDFWGLFIEIDNINKEQYESDIIYETAYKLVKYALDMANEMNDNQISFLDRVKMDLKAALEGFKIGRAFSRLLGF